VLNDPVAIDENFLFIRDTHTPNCVQVIPGAPAWACSCGARWSKYGRLILKGHNIVTTAGDVWYAQQAAVGIAATVPSVTDTFTHAVLGTGAGSAPAKNSTYGFFSTPITGAGIKIATSGWPRVDGPDADNTGAGAAVLSWKFEWTAGDFNDTAIADVMITNGAPSGTDPVLMHADDGDWTPSGTFDKTASDTLKFYVNHTLLGG
jgi:hypothetical protein